MKCAAQSGHSSPARSAFAGFRFPAEVIVVAVRSGNTGDVSAAPLHCLFGKRDESSAAAGQMARASPANAGASLVAGGVSSAMS